jgi:hypothetical protein
MILARMDHPYLRVGCHKAGRGRQRGTSSVEADSGGAGRSSGSVGGTAERQRRGPSGSGAGHLGSGGAGPPGGGAATWAAVVAAVSRAQDE